MQKTLAQLLPATEARAAMNAALCSPKRGRAFVAVFVSTAFLWALALSVSPQLHERIHRDANRVEHVCAVTFVASGTYEHSAHAPLLTAPLPAVQLSKLPALTPQWVESAFLAASIFEHAPPVCA